MEAGVGESIVKMYKIAEISHILLSNCAIKVEGEEREEGRAGEAVNQ